MGVACAIAQLSTAEMAAVAVERPEPDISLKKKYTRAEVALHKEIDDLWIIIYGRVYNVTNWAKKHPGGEVVLTNYGGEDASVRSLVCVCSYCKYLLYTNRLYLRHFIKT